MLRNFNLRGKSWLPLALGVLGVANLVAGALILFPPGGSADEVEQQLASLRLQVASRRMQLARTREHVAAVEKGRAEGDRFLSDSFLARRTAYATLLTELLAAADQSKIKPKEHAYSTDPIEGSDTLSRMIITANFEGTYANLMRFVHEIDRSRRMLIIESMNAAPQQGSGTLSINMKMDAFVREDGSSVSAEGDSGMSSK